MRLLATITDADLGLPAIAQKAALRRREAMRAVLFDGENVALLYVTKHGYHKIPGGGLEEGEDAHHALRRELLEETGCEAEIICEVGSVVERRMAYGLQQRSDCVLATVIKKRKRRALTDGERADGLELEWVAPDEAIRRFERDATEDYSGKFMSRRDLLFLRAAMAIRARIPSRNGRQASGKK